jgi:hypothetical protein
MSQREIEPKVVHEGMASSCNYRANFSHILG